MARTLVTVALALYNNVANLWPPFNGIAYVPANVAAAGLLLAIALGVLGLSSSELGLSGLSLGDLAVGGAAGAVLAAPLLVLARTRAGARVVADERVRHLRGGALVYQALVRVPLGTAVLEELAFRGVLFAAWRDEGEAVAAVVSCAVFGLWHVAPAATMVRVNARGATRSFVARSVAGTVVVTAAAGAALLWLRLETGSLAAPFAAHAVVNSLATVAGAVAGRRLERA
ncbi:MAG TPA: CPBP family glutamic-type intramembrane protease [Actinomycetota bacterium]|nr:CPBP family glutamic-type intramembrane protease [Actinomycetota bacterium]